MGLRSAHEYRTGLRDGRRLHYRGRLVEDVTTHPELAVAVDHAAIDFELAERPDLRCLAVDVDPVSGAECSAYWRVPRSGEDLRHRSALVEQATRAGATLVLLVKEIGSDALFGLLRVLDGEGLERAEAFLQHCRDGDLAVAVAQTDVKGHRALGPAAQPDPDHYVRVVAERSDGIVVRGAKVHTSVAANADELIVLPTRAMGPEEADWAVAFAVPVDTPGLDLYVSSWGSGDRDPFDAPVSSRHRMLETLTVFDDVFVPWERVFCHREPSLAGPVAHAFVDYHRFTAVSYKLPLLDAFVGAAAEIADMNGVLTKAHIRDKLARLIAWAETVRGLTELASHRAEVDARGIARPDPLTTNLAKLTFATGYHQAVATVQDCAGGLLVTGPGGEDWADPDTRAVLERFLGAAAPAEPRLRMLNLVADLTARDFGGYQAVLAVHAEGSIEAEKLQMARSYDLDGSRRWARDLAGLEPGGDGGGDHDATER
jgi:4-hydroxybutyryl-CoA dehydratase / vinylacetyl-CoA-Delta-isomerase